MKAQSSEDGLSMRLFLFAMLGAFALLAVTGFLMGWTPHGTALGVLSGAQSNRAPALRSSP